jgi:oxysterol-binding protein-related protein 3/6/7
VVGGAGLRFVAEKVSHHPVILASHVTHPAFTLWQEQRPRTRFWGQSLELVTEGPVRLRLSLQGGRSNDSGGGGGGGAQEEEEYVWSHVTTCMRNLLSDARRLEHYGTMTVANVRTGERCVVVFKVRSATPPLCASLCACVVVQLSQCLLVWMCARRRCRRGLGDS